jgi:hypothetical protein
MCYTKTKRGKNYYRDKQDLTIVKGLNTLNSGLKTEKEESRRKT